MAVRTYRISRIPRGAYVDHAPLWAVYDGQGYLEGHMPRVEDREAVAAAVRRVLEGGQAEILTRGEPETLARDSECVALHEWLTEQMDRPNSDY